MILYTPVLLLLLPGLWLIRRKACNRTDIKGMAVLLFLLHAIARKEAFVLATQLQIFQKLGLLPILLLFLCIGYDLKGKVKEAIIWGIGILVYWPVSRDWLIGAGIGLVIGMLLAAYRKPEHEIAVTFLGKKSLPIFLTGGIYLSVFRFLIERNGKPYIELFSANLMLYAAAVTGCSLLSGELLCRLARKLLRQQPPKNTDKRKIGVRKVLLAMSIALLLSFLEGMTYYLTTPSLVFIGHASVKLKTSGGKVIYIDPFYPTKFNYIEPADYILITHGHSDHNVPSLCAKKDDCRVITWKEALVDGKYQVFDDGEVTIEAVPGDGRGIHNASSNVGYIVSFDGTSVYHSADCDFTENKYPLRDKNIGYALYTVNDVYTMGPGEATEMADYIGARVNIPIHGDSRRYPDQRRQFAADGYFKAYINQIIFLTPNPRK